MVLLSRQTKLGVFRSAGAKALSAKYFRRYTVLFLGLLFSNIYIISTHVRATYTINACYLLFFSRTRNATAHVSLLDYEMLI